MMKLALAATAMLLVSACAGTGQAPMMELGYKPGALAVAAIGRSDWSAAEALLEARNGAPAGDPARLINLGKVYMETGRPGEALTAWRLALASEHHFMVETRDGRVVSTDVLARRAISRHERGVRTASQ